MDDGSGIVHIAPAFGDEDLGLGREHQLAFVQPVDLQGVITGNYPFAGNFVKDADPEITADLTERGLLYHQGIYRHTYPFCWRCDTPLLYYAKTSWYIRTTAVKDQLVGNNSRINWYPEHIREGRFGEWLRNNVDWAISRERYWGTPIPIWRCDRCGQMDCVGGVQELSERSGRDLEDLDLHRPYVDDVTWRCPAPTAAAGCSGRIPEVMDCWFDSGMMPLAQWHYPFENKDIDKDGRLPADYICEAVDQTRGWFYSLHALSTSVAGRHRVPQRDLPGPDPGWARPQDEQAPGQHRRAGFHPGCPRRRRPALVSVHRLTSRANRGGSPTGWSSRPCARYC